MEGYILQGDGKDGTSCSCDNRITTHLCKVTDIRTISEIMAEKGLKATKLMTNLMNLKLERQEKELELRGIELLKREVINENKRKKLAEEIEENAAKKSSLDEQRKANKRMMTLADDYKKEKEKLQEKIFFLENQLNEKQALEAEIESLMRQLNVVKHAGDYDSEVMKKIEEIKKNIEEKEEVMKKIEKMKMNIKEKEEERMELESLFETLNVRKRKSNDELHEARKLLNEGLKDLPKVGHIGVKRMGELKIKPFCDAVIAKKWPVNVIQAKAFASEVCAKWQDYLLNPNSYQFKVITSNNIPQGVIVDHDLKLETLRKWLGEEVYTAVLTAREEIVKYNSGRRYVTTELWNFTGSRKATLKEGVSCILNMWNAQKRRRIT